MRGKRFFITVFFCICLLFTLSAAAEAYQSEWVEENGVTYYYGKGGRKYTGGPKKITVNGKEQLYYFDETGALIKNKLSVKGTRLILSLADGRLLTHFGTIKGQTYYGTEKGYLKTGVQCHNGKYYFFNEKKGFALKNKWKKIKDYYYYFNSAGRTCNGGIFTINGKKYYFDSAGHRVSGLCQIKGHYYGFSSKNGHMLYGWQVMPDKRKYYFNPKNGQAYTNGFHKIDGKSYYFNSQGIRQKGWILIGNKRYYFDPDNNGARTYGKKTINGTVYDFGDEGYLPYTPTWNRTVRVNRKNCVITVYDADVPIKAITCSVGRPTSPTPTGTFFIQDHHRWWILDGPSWGQYCSHFLPQYLFHSVPMYGTSQDPYNVRASDYNNLGSPASGGCIRVSVADAKWICENVPVGSRVVISDNEAMPLGKPTPARMPNGSVGKDPTDIWS